MRFHIGSLVQEMLSGLDLPVQELIAFLLSGRLKCPHPILSKEEYKESMKLLKPSPRYRYLRPPPSFFLARLTVCFAFA